MRHRTAAGVGCNFHSISLSHVGNLAQFRYPTGMQHIRLHNHGTFGVQ